MAMPTDYLPKTTSFEDWSQENLAKLAYELWAENCQLRDDNKALHESWREAVRRELAEKQPLG